MAIQVLLKVESIVCQTNCELRNFKQGISFVWWTNCRADIPIKSIGFNSTLYAKRDKNIQWIYG